MDKFVRVGIAVLVKKVDKYLLLKRTSELGTDTWCPPGGKVEFGEDLGMAIMREFKEEVGDNIIISNPEFACITNDYFELEQQHYITIHTIADYISGEAKINEPNKFSDIGWFSIEEMNTLDLFLPMLNLKINNTYSYK